MRSCESHALALLRAGHEPSNLAQNTRSPSTRQCVAALVAPWERKGLGEPNPKNRPVRVLFHHKSVILDEGSFATFRGYKRVQNVHESVIVVGKLERTAPMCVEIA